jgi:signal transduction histidine kinase
MAVFFAAQALWLVPALGALVVITGGLFAWALRRGSGLPSARTTAKADKRIQVFLEKADLEVLLAEQADAMRVVGEVHEAAAVSLADIISQAEGAKFTAKSDPRLVSRAAQSIAVAARVTLNDIRRVVNSARGGVEKVDAVPNLAAIQDLFAAMTDSGLAVKFEENGAPFALVPSAELSIYRIAQEILVNSRTHGGPGTTVRVAFNWSQQGLHLRVDDDGSRAQRLRESGTFSGYTIADDHAALVEVMSGRGMKDMAHRAETFGGVFSAHRVPGVGFSVSVAFPTLRFHNGIHGVSVRKGPDGMDD